MKEHIALYRKVGVQPFGLETFESNIGILRQVSGSINCL